MLKPIPKIVIECCVSFEIFKNVTSIIDSNIINDIVMCLCKNFCPTLMSRPEQPCVQKNGGIVGRFHHTLWH